MELAVDHPQIVQNIRVFGRSEHQILQDATKLFLEYLRV